MGNQKLLIIGNGMAGVRCVEEILKHSNDFEITIIGREPHGNYNRIMLSSVLQGGTKMNDIMINDMNWYRENNIHLYTGETVIKINRLKRVVETDSGREIPYDKMIIATGSTPFMIPLPGVDLEGVMAFRTIEDCEKMVASAKSYKKATVIGGGLLGLEAAKGLLHLGMEVDVIHLGSYIMERQLDKKAAKLLQEELERQGMNFLLEKQTARLLGRNRVKWIEFKDGTSVRTDLVVMAVGVRPNIALAQDAGLEMNRAIIVNDYMQTNDPNIYAVGECVEHRGFVYGLVKPLYEQGVVLAKHLCNQPTRGYQGTVLSTQLKISGVDVFSVGQFHDRDDTNNLLLLDESERVYKKVVFKDDVVVGAVLYGDTKDGSALMKMIQKGENRKKVKELIINSQKKEDHFKEMAMSQAICNCNNVSKGNIIEAVQKKGCSTVEEIKTCTKATGSCGGCKPMVAELLAYIQSDHFNEAIVEEPFCSCTSLTEDDVLEEIVTKQLNTVDKVRSELKWSGEGCDACSNALHYYLRMIYKQESWSYSIEQLGGVKHQSDGRYSITMPLKGALLKESYLQDVLGLMKEYNQSKVVLTEDQRLMLVNVEKSNVRPIMERLKIERKPKSEFWIHKARTSIGGSIQQAYVEDINHIATELDEAIDTIFAPQHVFINVTANYNIGVNEEKELKLIRMSRGWEMYVSDQLIAVVEQEEAALLTITFLQYYRETAKYLEDLYSWLNRLGIIHIREVIFSTELRDQLIAALKVDLHQYMNIENQAIN